MCIGTQEQLVYLVYGVGSGYTVCSRQNENRYKVPSGPLRKYNAPFASPGFAAKCHDNNMQVVYGVHTRIIHSMISQCEKLKPIFAFK